MKKRFLSLLLGGILVLSISMTGCGNSKETSKDNEPVKTDKTEGKQEVKEEVKQEEKLEEVNLTWYIRNSKPKNVESVMEKVNELTKEKINTTVDIKFIEPGDYNQKMQMIMASGEEYDIAFTSSWANDYLNNVSRGAYIPLDDLLENHQDLKNLIPNNIWNGTRVNGKIYGIPNYQVMYDQPGLWFKKDLVEKYDLEEKINNATKLSDLTEVYQTIKDNEPTVIPFREGNGIHFLDYAPIIEKFYCINVETGKVYKRTAEDKKLQENYKISREWYQKGFFPEDVATMKNEDAVIKAGKIFSRYSRQKPGNEADLKNKYGFEVICKATGPAVINSGGILSTLNGISITSKNPERAITLLELASIDKELYNTLIFGVEGEDYKKVAENRIEKLPDTYSAPAWQLGNQFNAYLTPGKEDDIWEQTIKNNENAIADPIMGFSFDRTAVENELAQLSAIELEFIKIQSNGLDDPEKIQKLRDEKDKAAGEDKVIAEIQRQYDEWVKNK